MSLPAPWTILFGSQPLTFPLSGPTTDAVARLKGNVHATFLHTIHRAGLVGSVSEDRVRVRYQRPWFHNGFAPVFVGQFVVVSGNRALAGTLRLSRLAQIWLAVWFGFLTIFTLILVPAVLLGTAEPGAAGGLLVLLFLWTFGLGMVYFSWWLARRDKA